MKFEIIRTEYYPDRTIGRLEIDGVFFCYTLEDKVRAPGIKVYGQTAIPEGTYLVTLEPFKGNVDKMYPYLHNVPMFTGVCMHGGNGPEDSLGCILVGHNRDDQKIYNSAVVDLSKHIGSAQPPVYVTVRNGG